MVSKILFGAVGLVTGGGVFAGIVQIHTDAAALAYPVSALVGFFVSITLFITCYPRVEKLASWRYVRSFEDLASRRPPGGTSERVV